MTVKGCVLTATRQNDDCFNPDWGYLAEDLGYERAVPIEDSEERSLYYPQLF